MKKFLNKHLGHVVNREIAGWTDYYMIIKMCWTQAMSHLGIVAMVLSFVFQITALIGIFGIKNYVLIFSGVGLAIICVFVIGFFMLKKGFSMREVSLTNTINPEVVETLKLVRQLNIKVEKLESLYGKHNR